jgi:NTP pyrophosphatase (non-canonical NTP hydrolase)
MNELIELVQQWSENKGLDKADSRGQFLKVVEEVGEVAAALCRSDMDLLKDAIGDSVVTLIIYAQQNNLKLDCSDIPKSGSIDSRTETSDLMSYIIKSVSCMNGVKYNVLYGNIMDCCCYLVAIADKYNLTLKECLQAAYDVIKLRDGKMVNGIFVKSEDLPKPPYDKGAWTKLSATGAVAGFEGDQDKQGDLI